MSAGEDALGALADTLDQLQALVDLGKGVYDEQQPVRLAVQRLWIVAGECVRRYCEVAQVDRVIEPWSSLWGYRNFLAHHLLDEISDERVWAETLQDLSDYQRALPRT